MKVDVLIRLLLILPAIQACTDFYMNFTNFKLSGRTLDLSFDRNWTITSWPVSETNEVKSQPLVDWGSKYGALAITGNWFGDDKWGFPSLFGDSINEKGLSCSLLTLIDTQYEEKDSKKYNVFAGLFCFFAAQTFANVNELQQALADIAIWGPDGLAQHFIVKDATGATLVIELKGGEQQVYLDKNDGTDGFGVVTNEPTFDWHLENIKHHEWKKSRTRAAVTIPGTFYPDDRYLRAHMLKAGMQDLGLMQKVKSFQFAFSLTAMVLDSVYVPIGYNFGTDSYNDYEADHSQFALIRDHKDPSFYWRDIYNPTFRKIRLADVDTTPGAPQMTIKMEKGPFFIDMVDEMEKLQFH